jgi:hypothetical protein
MKISVWIDDFIVENDIIFVGLMIAIKKREERQNKRIKID